MAPFRCGRRRAGATWPVPPVLLALALELLDVRRAEGKFVQASVQIGGPSRNASQWAYLSKFGYHLGTGSYALRLKGARNAWSERAEATLTFEVHLDEEWDSTELLPACERLGRARTHSPLRLPLDGSWTPWMNGSLWQNVRPHVWYFALRDCRRELPHPTQIDFELRLLQAGGSELSVELRGTPGLAAAEVLLGLAFGAWFGRGCWQVRQTMGEVHLVIIALACAALSQYVAYVLHAIHLRVYVMNGLGLWSLDALSEVCSIVSQVVITSIGISLAHGHTILPGQEACFSVLAPAFAVIAAVHVVLVALAKLRDDASFKFHENEGAHGVALVLCRLALFLWFLLAMWRTYRGSSPKLRPFLTQFCLASSLNYLAYPVLFVVAAAFAPYLRHKVVLLGLFLMQSSSLAWYTRMFLTRGQYFEVSTLGANFLPTPQGSRKTPKLFGRPPPELGLAGNPSPLAAAGGLSPMSPNVWQKSQ